MTAWRRTWRGASPAVRLIVGRVGRGGRRATTLPAGAPRPHLLDGSVVGQDNALPPDELAGLRRGQELVVGPAHAPAAGVERPRLLVAQAGVDRPLAQARRQGAQQLGVPGGLALEVEAEAVQEPVVGDG